MLELYFRPMACSLASRIALTEAGIEARYHSVNLRTNTDRRGLLIGRWRDVRRQYQNIGICDRQFGEGGLPFHKPEGQL